MHYITPCQICKEPTERSTRRKEITCFNCKRKQRITSSSRHRERLLKARINNKLYKARKKAEKLSTTSNSLQKTYK